MDIKRFLQIANVAQALADSGVDLETKEELFYGFISHEIGESGVELTYPEQADSITENIANLNNVIQFKAASLQMTNKQGNFYGKYAFGMTPDILITDDNLTDNICHVNSGEYCDDLHDDDHVSPGQPCIKCLYCGTFQRPQNMGKICSERMKTDFIKVLKWKTLPPNPATNPEIVFTIKQ